MLKLTKGDMPIGDFTTYDDLYQYLNGWKNRTHLENCSKPQHGFLPPLAIKATRIPGTGYGAPHYQEIPHGQSPSISEQIQGSGQRNGQESSQQSGWETLPLPALPEVAPQAEGFHKQWCLAYCHAHNLTVTEMDNEGARPKLLVETSNVVSSANTTEPETQGGTL